MQKAYDLVPEGLQVFKGDQLRKKHEPLCSSELVFSFGVITGFTITLFC